MIPFDEALRRVTEDAAPLRRMRVPLAEAAGRVLASPLSAPFDLPPFDRSAVDGYGVRAEDVPGTLHVAGEIAAGDDPARIEIKAGQAVRLFTGSGIPPGIDSIVMQEDVRREGPKLTVPGRVGRGDYIRRRGAEVSAGAEILSAGVMVSPPVLSMLATVGESDAEVWSRPRVRLVATGNELVRPGQTLLAGRVYESILPGLARAVELAGGETISSVICPDSPAELQRVLTNAIDADILIAVGGVSIGDHDLVRGRLAEMGVETRVDKVAMRPGKPFYFGVAPHGARVFGLPGNPVSALVTFYLLVRPVLAKLTGRLMEPSVRLPLGFVETPLVPGNRDDFLRASIANGRVHPASAQESHMLTGLAGANALIRIRGNSGPFSEGMDVEVIPINW